MTQATGQQKVEVFPSSETEFFLKVVDAQITFVRGPGRHGGPAGPPPGRARHAGQEEEVKRRPLEETLLALRRVRQAPEAEESRRELRAGARGRGLARGRPRGDARRRARPRGARPRPRRGLPAVLRGPGADGPGLRRQDRDRRGAAPARAGRAGRSTAARPRTSRWSRSSAAAWTPRWTCAGPRPWRSPRARGATCSWTSRTSSPTRRPRSASPPRERSRCTGATAASRSCT